jgi:hypothetical protein
VVLRRRSSGWMGNIGMTPAEVFSAMLVEVASVDVLESLAPDPLRTAGSNLGKSSILSQGWGPPHRSGSRTAVADAGAGRRQVPGDPDFGLANMAGAGGECFIHILAL